MTAPTVDTPGSLRGGRMAVAVVNWNTRDDLRRCLTTVLAEAPAQVVVADTGSSDGSVEMVSREFPTVLLRLLPHNPGYGAGCNAAVRASSAEYVLVLNSDTLLRPGALAALTGVLDQEPRAGVVGPRILHPDGRQQRSCYPFPSPAARVLVHEPFATAATLIPPLRETYVGRWRGLGYRRVPWVLGAALAIRRAAFEEVGGFDESYEMYFEEVDLCWRLRARGWDTFFAPVTDVIHSGGASTAQRRSAMRARYELSLMEFHRRYHRGLTRAIGLGIIRVQAGARYLRDTLRYHASGKGPRRDELAEDRMAWRAVMASLRQER